MDQTNFHGQSLDEMVFDNRNKSYGAYVLRRSYNNHLSKALFISTSVFVLALFSPKIASMLGLTKSAEDKPIIETVYNLIDINSTEQIETIIQPYKQPAVVETNTVRNIEVTPVDVATTQTDPQATVDDLRNSNSGLTTTTNSVTTNSSPVTSNIPADIPSENTTYESAIVDQKASFIGGPEALETFVTDNVTYPELEIVNNVTGTASVSFIVNQDGQVEDAHISKSSGSKILDAEAVKVVRKTSKLYKPARMRGKAVRSYCKMDISFE